MRLIVTAEPDHFDAALKLAREEIGCVSFQKYTRVGWGWSFGTQDGSGPRFFVRRLKDGLSIKQAAP